MKRDDSASARPRTHTFTLTGWRAAAVLAVLVALGAWRLTRARSALEGQGRKALEPWVAGERQRPLLTDTTLGLAEKGQALLDVSTVRIRALDAHGPLDDVVVRVEIEPNPAFPPDFGLVRYYRMQYSSLTGWSYLGDADALLYWLAFI